MDKKVWQRAVADLNPPGVPNSFRRAHRQQNVASTLLRRETGGARRAAQLLGEDRAENFWAERESAAKVRFSIVKGSLDARVCVTKTKMGDA